MDGSEWIRDYSGANVVNLDKVCWQSCVLAGTFHIQDHKGQLESQNHRRWKEMVLKW